MVKLRHDQSLGMFIVPQAIHATTIFCKNLPLKEELRSHTQCTKVPKTVVDSSDDTTVLGVADLGKENRGGHLGQTATETEEQSTGDIH